MEEAPLPSAETGATWLDLVATVSGAYGPAPVDRLTGPGVLRVWLVAEGLAPETVPDEADLALAKRLREALRGLALAVVRSRPWPAGDIALVNDVLAHDRPVRLTVRRTLRRPADAKEALARVARQAVEDLTGPAAAQLHTCADAVCGMLFLDPTGRRRWCSVAVCGVRHRVRAHRERRKAGTAD